MSDSLSLQRDGAVARVRLNRPELHNAFDAGLIESLNSTLESLGTDVAVRVVVLEGAGASFSAGADLNWMRGMASASEADNLADSLRLATLMRTLNFMGKPTIARVNGSAYGGGVGLIACCDIAIATRNATFGLTEARLGLLPAVISPYVIAAIGARQARRWFATAERFDAAEAQRIGLVHMLVDDEAALDAAVMQQSELLLQAGPIAAASAKALVRRIAHTGDAATIDGDNAALIAALRVSPEGQEGLAAFLGKRRPAWTTES